MIRHTSLKHKFVDCFPDRLQPGILYVSMEYASASHSCCCGCGEEIVTPFMPTEWKMTFDGEAVALWPSIGNWNLPCRSHYIIRDGRAIEAAPWSDEQIASEKRRDRRAKDDFYEHPISDPSPSNSEDVPEPTVKSSRLYSALRWLVNMMGLR